MMLGPPFWKRVLPLRNPQKGTKRFDGGFGNRLSLKGGSQHCLTKLFMPLYAGRAVTGAEFAGHRALPLPMRTRKK